MNCGKQVVNFQQINRPIQSFPQWDTESNNLQTNNLSTDGNINDHHKKWKMENAKKNRKFIFQTIKVSFFIFFDVFFILFL